MCCCCGRRKAVRLRDETPLLEDDRATPWQLKDAWESDQGPASVNDDIVNVLAVFTSSCLDENAWKCIAQVELIQLIQQSIDDLNTALQNTNVAVRARLVAIEQIGVHDVFATNEPTPGWYKDCLLGTQSVPVDGCDALRTKTLLRRTHHQAHVLVFVTGYQSNASPEGGALPAKQKDEAFVVVPWNELVREYTTAHEIGHLFGCKHDEDCGTHQSGLHRGNDGNSNHGYITKDWRTIMAYDPRCGCGKEVIPYFSNPSVQYQGKATGTNKADNATQIAGYTQSLLALRG